MEILSSEEMAARLDYASPIKPQAEERESIWCVPFEYGSLPKGTKISIPKAREIQAELRAQIAEWEKRELRRALDDEKARAAELSKQRAAREQELDQRLVAAWQVAHKLRKKLSALKKRR